MTGRRFQRTTRPSILEEEEESRRVFQTEVIVWGNVAIALAVLGAWLAGYRERPSFPWVFFALELVVIVVGAVSVYAENFARAAVDRWKRLGTGDPPSVGDAARGSWRERRPLAQRNVVFVLAGLVMLSLTLLVFQTGLGIESPFVPLAAAPAVFGPFVARERPVVLALALMVSALLAGIWELAPQSPCGWEECGAAEREARRPRPIVYLAVTVTLLAITALIAAERLRREQELRDEIRRMRAPDVESGVPERRQAEAVADENAEPSDATPADDQTESDSPERGPPNGA